MKNKKIIAFIVLLILGFGAIIFSISGPSPYNDIFTLTDADLGQTVTVRGSEPFKIDDHNWLLYFENEIDYKKSINVRVELNDSLASEATRCFSNEAPLTGILRSETEEMREKSYQTQFNYMAEQFNDDVPDRVIADINNRLSPYYIEATALNGGLLSALKKGAVIAGIVFLIAALIVLRSICSKKSIGKVVRNCLIVMAIPLVIVGILFFKKIITVCSIRSDGIGVYYMEYAGEYKLDSMLDANITSTAEFAEWLRKAEFCHLPIPIDTDRFSCSSFKAKTPDGDVLFGRNFDYPETDSLMIYSAPKDGYASYSMADLEVFGVGIGQGKISPDSIPGRFIMSVAPYAACDGVNEAGLGVSTLGLDIGEIHQDTGKPDLFVYTAIRLLLDRCANVEEALKLLETFDIHSYTDVRQHLFIADKSGRSVVVEWFDDQMYVNELDAVTNSVLTPGEHYDEGADDRLPTILDGLKQHDGILTPEQARDLLAAAAQKNWTEWSCVYNLNDFSVDLYVDEDYEHAYHYGGKR